MSGASMMWMPMPGQTWAGAATSFVGMWVLMTAAMMLPSLAPKLQRYRRSVAGTSGTALGLRTALVSFGYFFIWTVFGAAVFPVGAALAAVDSKHLARAHIDASVVGVVVLIAGAWQLTAWKAHHLACCRREPECGPALSADAGTAWRHGVRLGVHCVRCCANLMAISLAMGIMDLRAMVLVGATITLERLAPAGDRVARASGFLLVGAGLFLIT